MTLRRGFWIGAAGLLGLAALISIVALVRGEFTETDGKILATLGAAFLAGSLALSGSRFSTGATSCRWAGSQSPAPPWASACSPS